NCDRYPFTTISFSLYVVFVSSILIFTIEKCSRSLRNMVCNTSPLKKYALSGYPRFVMLNPHNSRFDPVIPLLFSFRSYLTSDLFDTLVPYQSVVVPFRADHDTARLPKDCNVHHYVRHGGSAPFPIFVSFHQ